MKFIQQMSAGQTTVGYVLTVAVMALGLGSIFMSPQLRQGLALLYTDAASRVIGGGSSGSAAQIATWGTDEVEVEASIPAPHPVEPKLDTGPIPTTLPPQSSQPTNTTQAPEAEGLPPGIIAENPSASLPQTTGNAEPASGIFTEQINTTATVDVVPTMSQETNLSSSFTESATCQET